MVRARLGWLRIGLVAAVAVLGACGGDDKPDPKIPPANSSEAFTDGYGKGCPLGFAASKSGSNWASSPVDERYSQDLEYKKGWDQGYFTCNDSDRGGSTLGSINPF
jgi:hypothetical protein